MLQKNHLVSLVCIFILSACASEKKETETVSTDGPNVIIDSTGFKNTNGTNKMPLNANQPAVNQTLVSSQQQATTSTQQSVQLTSEQMQQIQQQALQAQQKQQIQQVQTAQQPQQIQTIQQPAHPQFSAAEFAKMQNDAKKRGVELNPAHGQPGHRCDIYVGQPLDSKPVESLKPQTNTLATAATATTTPQIVTAAPQPVKTELGMNPPHGQSGHRCDIAVGAPLNSKPVTPPLQAVPAPATNSKTDSAKGGK
jgi:hypothetical protein